MSITELNAINIDDQDLGTNRKVNDEKMENIEEFDLDKKFLNKYKNILIQIFKYYSNLIDSANYILLSFTAFLRLMKDIGIIECLDTSSFNNEVPKNKSNILKRNNSMTSIKTPEFVTYNHLNILFSKFSCDNQDKDDAQDKNKNKITYLYFKKNYSVMKIKNPKNFEKIKLNSNKRITFCEFLKIIICISNKLFNPSHNYTTLNSQNYLDNSKKTKVDILLNVDSGQSHIYLEKFIVTYFIPIFIQIKPVVDNQENEIKILRTVYYDDNFVFKFVK